jgi:hypothetical protein
MLVLPLTVKADCDVGATSDSDGRVVMLPLTVMAEL